MSHIKSNILRWLPLLVFSRQMDLQHCQQFRFFGEQLMFFLLFWMIDYGICYAFSNAVKFHHFLIPQFWHYFVKYLWTNDWDSICFQQILGSTNFGHKKISVKEIVTKKYQKYFINVFEKNDGLSNLCVEAYFWSCNCVFHWID